LGFQPADCFVKRHQIGHTRASFEDRIIELLRVWRRLPGAGGKE
jgi:hypothetical protein